LTVVLFYSLFGLSDNEIAHTVNISVSDVKKLKSLDAYQETYDLLFWEMIHSNGQSLVAKIAKAAPAALDEVIISAKMLSMRTQSSKRTKISRSIWSGIPKFYSANRLAIIWTV